MKKFKPDYTLTKPQILGRIDDMKKNVTTINHEREQIDKQVNVLKSLRNGVNRRVSNTQAYINNLESLLTP